MKRIPLSALVSHSLSMAMGFSSPQTCALLAGFLGSMDLSFTTQFWAAIERRDA